MFNMPGIQWPLAIEPAAASICSVAVDSAPCSCGCAVCRCDGFGGIVRPVVIRSIVCRMVVIVAVGLKVVAVNSLIPVSRSRFFISRLNVDFSSVCARRNSVIAFPIVLPSLGNSLGPNSKSATMKDRDHFRCT